jgi:hypothetical protein
VHRKLLLHRYERIEPGVPSQIGLFSLFIL